MPRKVANAQHRPAEAPAQPGQLPAALLPTTLPTASAGMASSSQSPADHSHSPELSLSEVQAFLRSEGDPPDNSTVVANMLAAAASSCGPHFQNNAEANLTAADTFAVLDAYESCGPHKDCCGGFFNHLDKSFTHCRKRLGFPFQHARGIVCLSKHSFYKCSSCNNVLHKECWLQKADGNCVLVQKDQTFQCLKCEMQKDTDQVVQRAARVYTLMLTVMQGTKIDSSEANDAGATKEDLEHDQHEADKKTISNSELMHFENMTRKLLMKEITQHNWKVRSSVGPRIYFHCALGTCDVQIKARALDEHQEKWSLDGAHTNHPCGGGVVNRVFNGMYTFKDSLPEAVVKEIENLSTLTSKQIQRHLLSKDSSMLVDTGLIQNMTYRIKQKMFGTQGDVAHLLEQQQVPVHQSVYTLYVVILAHPETPCDG
jgi:hypothetical protein